MRKASIVIILLAGLVCLPVLADIYKCANSYTDKRQPGCELITVAVQNVLVSHQSHDREQTVYLVQQQNIINHIYMRGVEPSRRARAPECVIGKLEIRRYIDNKVALPRLCQDNYRRYRSSEAEKRRSNK